MGDGARCRDGTLAGFPRGPLVSRASSWSSQLPSPEGKEVTGCHFHFLEDAGSDFSQTAEESELEVRLHLVKSCPGPRGIRLTRSTGSQISDT